MGKSKELAELGDVVTQNGGNVGIGTSTTVANSILNVNGGINSNGIVGMATNDSFTLHGKTQPHYGTNFSHGGTSSPSGISGYYGLSFAAGGLERMKVDEFGRVTMPYQPAFDAGLTSASGGVGAVQTVLFDNVRLNQGNHYSSSTGRFTAPINGVYEFYWGGIKNGTTSVTRAVLRRNGTDIRENRLAEGDLYNAACWIMLLELNAFDYVDITVTAGSFYGSTDFYGNAFGGRLVG